MGDVFWIPCILFLEFGVGLEVVVGHGVVVDDDEGLCSGSF